MALVYTDSLLSAFSPPHYNNLLSNSALIKSHVAKIMTKTLSVIIPSRTQAQQMAFLVKAIGSIRHQTIAQKFNLRIFIAIDQGAQIDESFCENFGVICIESKGRSQAAALNAGIRVTNSDYVAFLEDDDQWMPPYLATAMDAISLADFVSSTQAEYNENQQFLRINDFPTPSGWFMPRATLEKIGEFNESFRFHLDNEWLGRLCAAKLKRLHMAEATAPINMQFMHQVRPWLANVVNFSDGTCQIARHQSPYPLINRLVHTGSGMAQIAQHKSMQEISRQENKELVKRFGRTPW